MNTVQSVEKLEFCDTEAKRLKKPLHQDRAKIQEYILK